MEARTEVGVRIMAGFLEEGASGDRLWAPGHSQQRETRDALHKGQLKLHGERRPGTLVLGSGVLWFLLMEGVQGNPESLA